MPSSASDAVSSGRWITVPAVIIILACQLFSITVAATLLVFLFLLISSSSISVSLLRRLRICTAQSIQAEEKLDLIRDGKELDLVDGTLEPNILALCKTLAAELPDCVIFQNDKAAFKNSIDSYWAQQEREVIPACVVQPRDTEQLSAAVKTLKREYDGRRAHVGEAHSGFGLFAIRSGGHSPIPGAASIKGGVMIDLRHFCEVTPSKDGTTVVIGTGARWMDVSKTLEAKGLAVVGGRNSAVGVGGLVLGGGLSFFTPRYGPVCSNVLSYEIVLASGSVTITSASASPDLFKALKGGSNNYGVVTRFTVPSFSITKVWSGFLWMPGFQAPRVLAAFHQCVNKVNAHDDHAAGPMACFSYVQQLGIEVITVNLVYTKPPEKENAWPICFENSPFSSIWRLWSTCKTRTLTSATDELNSLSPYGLRQLFATTTIKNDPATIAAAHAAYKDGIASLNCVKGMAWTFVLQPFLPEWMRKGDANPMGFDMGFDNDDDEPLVLVGFTNNWDEARDDEFVKSVTRRIIEQIDAAAAANGTGHRYRYLNYCAEWQKPFESYGEENWRFMKEVSKKYDPDQFFQKGCIGGFKLDLGAVRLKTDY